MAIAMARQGGIGIIHRFLAVEDQANEVRRVKRAESFVIAQPYTVAPDETVERARLLMERYDVGGLIVTDAQGRLIGMLSARDVRFVRNPDLFVQDVMTPRQRLVTAPADISVEEAQDIFDRHKIEKLPLVDNGRVAGLITARDLTFAGSNPRAAKDKRDLTDFNASAGWAGGGAVTAAAGTR